MWHTDRPEQDAQEYFRTEPQDYLHKCSQCENVFDSGYSCNDEIFCKDCVNGNQHIKYYANLKLNHSDILFILQDLKTI